MVFLCQLLAVAERIVAHVIVMEICVLGVMPVKEKYFMFHRGKLVQFMSVQSIIRNGRIVESVPKCHVIFGWEPEIQNSQMKNLKKM